MAKKAEHLKDEASLALEVVIEELKACQLVVDEASEAARLREQVKHAHRIEYNEFGNASLLPPTNTYACAGGSSGPLFLRGEREKEGSTVVKIK